MQTLRKILFVLVAMLLLARPCAAFAAYPIAMDGDLLQFDVAPEVKQDSLFVPIRTIAEKTGAAVIYSGREISIINSDPAAANIKLTLGDTRAVVQAQDGTLAVCDLAAAPYIKNGRTMVPLRFVAEQLYCNVNYRPGRFIKIIMPGDVIGGQCAYTMALGSNITGRKHIVNNCIAMLTECKGQAIAKPDNIVPRSSWGEYMFYNRQSELIANWRFWVPEGVQHWPYGTLYLQNVLTDQYYEADETVVDYYFADNGKHLELEIATFMGSKGSIYD